MKLEEIKCADGRIREVFSVTGVFKPKNPIESKDKHPTVDLTAYLHRKACEKYAKDRGVSFVVAWNALRE